jgi:conjugative transfer pilus assembly protein TraH
MSIFGGGSILDNIASNKNIDSGYVKLMRGFVGDVWVDKPSDTGTTFLPTYIKPCDKSKNIQNFYAGDIEERDSGVSAGCTASTDTNKNLYQFAANTMTSIAGKMKTGTPLSSDEQTFANTLSLTIMPVLQAAVASGTEGMIIGQLSDVAAKEFAFAMLTDLFSINAQMLAQAHSIESAANGSSSGKDSNTCILTPFKSVVAALVPLEETVQKVMIDLKADLAKSATDLNALNGLADNMRKYGEIVDQELSKRFSRGIAKHVVGG